MTTNFNKVRQIAVNAAGSHEAKGKKRVLILINHL
jgi:hypothetical protein